MKRVKKKITKKKAMNAAQSKTGNAPERDSWMPAQYFAISEELDDLFISGALIT